MTIEQGNLFSAPPSHRADPETSRHAADVAGSGARAHRDKILVYLLRIGDHGATADDCWHATGGALPSGAGTRLGELAKPKEGPPLVEQTDRRRNTSRGNPAVVWVLTEAGRVRAAQIRQEVRDVA